MRSAEAEGGACRRQDTYDDGQIEVAVSRRALIAGLVAATATGRIEMAAEGLRERISVTAEKLAALMDELHGGGAWYADVDHEGPSILVGRDLAGP